MINRGKVWHFVNFPLLLVSGGECRRVWVWWYSPVKPAVRRTQEDSHKFWANLVYIVKSRLARGILETHLKGWKTTKECGGDNSVGRHCPGSARWRSRGRGRGMDHEDTKALTRTWLWDRPTKVTGLKMTWWIPPRLVIGDKMNTLILLFSKASRWKMRDYKYTLDINLQSWLLPEVSMQFFALDSLLSLIPLLPILLSSCWPKETLIQPGLLAVNSL